jgi:putative hydrolase of the HAD superfamily
MSSETIEAVLFDYGLVLSGPPDPNAWARMRKITGLEQPALHDAYWAYRLDYDRGTHTGPSYWKTTGQHAGLDLTPSQVDELIAADTALWTQPNQPMIDWAHRLQAAGTRTGILSNLGDSMTAGVLQKFPWLLNFDHRIWSHTLNLTKPDPAVYHAAATGLGIPAAAILFVDDRPENIDGALAAGMQTIPYTDHQTFLDKLEARGLGDLWLHGRHTPKGVTVLVPETEL